MEAKLAAFRSSPCRRSLLRWRASSVLERREIMDSAARDARRAGPWEASFRLFWLLDRIKRCPMGRRSALLAALLMLAAGCSHGPLHLREAAWVAEAWDRHTIDDSSLGADGVRLADVNGDGHLDIVSPWEQGGRVRLYLNPGPSRVRDRWPAVTVGEVGDPEDAFLVDLDGDGAMDVVSACEGSTRAMFVHWAPPDPGRLMDPSAWTTEPIPETVGAARWMYATALQVDGKHGVDLIAGARGEGAQIGWLEAPEAARNLDGWLWHPLYDAGWVMTLRLEDLDGDGDVDVVASDRMEAGRGVLWLENPGLGAGSGGGWTTHRVGPVNAYEAMHHDIADLDEDGLRDILVAAKGTPVRYHRRTSDAPPSWETHEIAIPPGAAGGKSVKVADIDLDGQPDLVVACEHATDGKIGVFWLSYGQHPSQQFWTPTSISGPEGFIYDLMQLLDLDADGDLDVLTLEEKGPYLAAGYEGSELGVIWYENPVR